MDKEHYGTPHYLRPFKKVLDDTLGRATLHVCFEASHPNTLGRACDLVMRIVQFEQFDEINEDPRDQIKVHFIPDRLSVPPLDGHILAIGGPRSNVIARIAMEYEADPHKSPHHYCRPSQPYFPMDIIHTHPDDYDGRLFADMESLDPEAIEIIYHYFKIFDQPPLKGVANLFSVNRHLRAGNNVKLPSLSVSVREKKDGDNDEDESAAFSVKPTADYVIYDHFVETILPNILCEQWKTRALITYHGLRTLGTFAALAKLENADFLRDLKNRLHTLRDTSGRSGVYPSAQQSCWSVVRSPNSRIGAQSDDEKFFQHMAALGFNRECVKFEERFALKYQAKLSSRSDTNADTVCTNDIEAFRKELNKRKLNNQQENRPPSVKLDEIDADQILDAMSLQRDKLFRRHDVYVLGCFERTKTVYTQQSRALTLIHALFKAGKIAPHRTKIVIVGGGVSGMAAAIAASETRARVVLLEAEDRLIPVQRKSRHRTLHPYFYDWPQKGSERDKTRFPIDELNWEVAAANEVFKRLRKNFKKYKGDANGHGDAQMFNVFKQRRVCGYLYDATHKKHYLTTKPFEHEFKRFGMDYTAMPSRDADYSKSEWEKLYSKWNDNFAKFASRLRRQARTAGGLGASEDTKSELKNFWYDADIVIFATGYGEEAPEEFLKDNNINLPARLLLNNSYWKSDQENFDRDKDRKGVFVVSGAGDGALIDILRLCIKEFEKPEWHKEFIRRMNEMTRADQSGAIWSNRRNVLVFANKLKDLFESDEFRLVEGEKERLRRIELVLAGFDIDAFLDDFKIKLNDAVVYNVANEPQPFWADSALAHRLLIWCLYKKGKVLFISGKISKYKRKVKNEEEKDEIVIERRILAKRRKLAVDGVVIRHGVGDQNASFLHIPGLLFGYDKDPNEIARDGQRLVSLLRLSNDLHPETEKFFRHTIKNLR